jgi:hypothetical protein
LHILYEKPNLDNLATHSPGDTGDADAHHSALLLVFGVGGHWSILS